MPSQVLWVFWMERSSNCITNGLASCLNPFNAHNRTPTHPSFKGQYLTRIFQFFVLYFFFQRFQLILHCTATILYTEYIMAHWNTVRLPWPFFSITLPKATPYFSCGMRWGVSFGISDWYISYTCHCHAVLSDVWHHVITMFDWYFNCIFNKWSKQNINTMDVHCTTNPWLSWRTKI